MKYLPMLSLGSPLVLLLAVPAIAQQDNQSGTNAKASDVATQETIIAGPNSEEVICKRDKVTGSRVAAKRVCKTAQVWAQELREARRTVEKGQNERTWEDR